MKEPFDFADEFGPKKVIHVHNPAAGLRGILVIDNTAIGPAIGGLRMAPDVSLEECFRLARAMTMKNAAAGLSHGGGKSVIFADPSMEPARKEQLIRCMARTLTEETDYIFGPDMGTNETCMAWVRDEIGRAVGLPAEIGGIPLDEIGATGWGILHAAETAAQASGFSLEGARVSIQGFGAVGKHTARFLSRKGARITSVSDSKGTIEDPQGLDVEALIEKKARGESVSSAGNPENAVTAECDILVPAARPDVIRGENVDRVRARVIVCGANIPVTPDAEERLHARNVLVIPDFIANAGGVICAAMEYSGSTRSAVFDAIAEKIRANTEEVIRLSREKSLLPRASAREIALRRLRRAMELRRFRIF